VILMTSNERIHSSMFPAHYVVPMNKWFPKSQSNALGWPLRWTPTWDENFLQRKMIRVQKETSFNAMPWTWDKWSSSFNCSSPHCHLMFRHHQQRWHRVKFHRNGEVLISSSPRNIRRVAYWNSVSFEPLISH
jgi:hypothetical protein